MILGKEQERLQEEAAAAAAAAERMESVLAAVSRAHSEPLRRARLQALGGWVFEVAACRAELGCDARLRMS